MEDAEDDLRQLDERPLPQGRARRLRRGRRPRHGTGELAHLPGADQAVVPAAGHARRRGLQFAAGLPHIWWGVSVEDRAHGLVRIKHLQQAPAAVRFLSIEPLLEDLGEINLEGIHWVIVGGESGAGARPMQKEWVLSIRDQCERAGVPFFFKQWGGVRKSKAGRELDGRTYDDRPRVEPRPVAEPSRRLAMIAEVERFYAPVDTTSSPSGAGGGF